MLLCYVTRFNFYAEKHKFCVGDSSYSSSNLQTVSSTGRQPTITTARSTNTTRCLKAQIAKRFTRKQNIHIKSLRMRNNEGNSSLKKDPVSTCQLENTTSIQKQPIRHIANQKHYIILTPTYRETYIRNTHKSLALERDRVHLHVGSRQKPPPPAYQKLRTINCKMRPSG